MVERKLNRRDFLRISGFGLLGAAAAACVAKPETATQKALETVAVLEKLATATQKMAEKVKATLTQTPKPSETPEPSSTPKPTDIVKPSRPDFKTESGGPYTPEQQQLIDSGAFSRQEQLLSDFYIYWMGANNRPVFPVDPGQRLNYEYIFGTENPDEACVAIPAVGYAGADLLAVPYVQGNPAKAAPVKYVNGEIETGQAPLLLTKGGVTGKNEPFVIGCRDSRWVRRNQEGGVAEYIGQDGSWTEILKLQQNPENLDAYTRVDLNQIKSGQVAASARAIAQPFPEEAFMSEMEIQTNLMENYGYEYADLLRDPKYKKDPKTRPMRWVSFFVIGLEGEDWLGGNLQVLNENGSFGMLNTLVAPKKVMIDEKNKNSESWTRMIGMLRDNNAHVSIISAFSENCNKVWEYGQVACSLYKQDNQSSLIRNWVNTGNVPKQLESLLVREVNSLW